MRTTSYALSWILSGALFLPALATAQTVPPRSADVAPRFDAEIVVTPERSESPRAEVAAATAVLGREELDALPIVHPSEILGFVPGVTVAQGQFYAAPPVVGARGFFGGGEAEYVRLLVDGLPVGDVESGLIDWSLISASSIRRIEAARGPGASMYGDAALGGVIQILTGPPTNAADLTVSAGSFGSVTADGSYGARAFGKRFTASGAARRTDGAFAHAGGEEVVGSGAVEAGSNGRVWRWSASGEHRNRDDPGSVAAAALAIDPRASDPAFRFDNADRSGFSTALTLRDGRSAWRPQVRGYFSGRTEDRVRTIMLAPGLSDTQARALTSMSIGGSLDAERSFADRRRPTLRFGADLAREHLRTGYAPVGLDGSVGSTADLTSGSRMRTGLFGSASVEPFARLRLTGALRWDDVADDGFGGGASLPRKVAWSPRAGLVVRLNEARGIVAFAQASRAFKAPTLDQMFDRRPYPDFQGGAFTISNPMLLPQRSGNVEGGVSGSGPLRWSAVVYRTMVDQEIDFDLSRFTYVNIGRSRHAGIEVEGQAVWWNRVRPSASYAWVRVSDLSGGERGRQLKNVPQQVWSASVSTDLPWKIGAVARVASAAGAYLDDANTLPIERPATLDLRVRRSLRQHVVFVDVINVTDRSYLDYGYTLTDFRGRTVPYAYPAAGRAVRAGVRVAF
jgi:outer membrane receptor protein involved in Fe transport